MSSSAAFSSPDHQYYLSPSEKLCYVHCDFCDTVLAVSVPCSSLFMTVAVRCGHCTNLLSVNMRALQLPSPSHQLHQLGHSNFFTPQSLREEIRSSPSNMLIIDQPNPNESRMPGRGVDELPRLPSTNKGKRYSALKLEILILGTERLLVQLQRIGPTFLICILDFCLINP
ncbi:axial regulator YABBY 1-like isoform X2 [Apium graveolens]|uniref:axial regulator YABBY 1-like isoform X2 n=1 Tax=Apium graveolens TaxID=4045 RepID=UPI003D79B3F1